MKDILNIKREEARARMKSSTISRLGQFIFASKNLLVAICHLAKNITLTDAWGTNNNMSQSQYLRGRPSKKIKMAISPSFMMARWLSLFFLGLLLAACGDTKSDATVRPSAPVLRAEVRGIAFNLVTRPVAVNITATKQDNSPTTNATFPITVASAGLPNCIATLEGAPSKEYNATTIGSVIMLDYSVTSDFPGRCGAFAFTAEEDGAVGTFELAAGSIEFIPDMDRDGIIDADDVDDDGDGLIELRTAIQLSMMRNNFAGTSLMVADIAQGDSTGCGGGANATGGTITSCHGYEQIADIDILAAGYTNWEPIGFCTPIVRGSTHFDIIDRGFADCSGNAFTGEFNGNGYDITNLVINVSASSYRGANYGIGFFGNIGDGAHLQNINIIDASIDGNNVSDQGNLGILVGYGRRANITNSLVSGYVSSTMSRVGGLIGTVDLSTVTHSSAITSHVTGGMWVGGLAGYVDNRNDRILTRSLVRYSYAESDYIDAKIYSSGGLIGEVINSDVAFSMALVGTVNRSRTYPDDIDFEDNVGGLVGLVLDTGSIDNSLAVVNTVSGNYNVGGMLGKIEYMSTIDLTDSLAVTNNIIGNHTGVSRVGGLVGGGGIQPIINIEDSFWDSKTNFFNKTNGVTLTPRDASTHNELTATLQESSMTPGSIYENWNDEACASGEYPWDFGDSTQYPALNCLPISVEAQREKMAQILERPGFHRPAHNLI